MPITFLSQPLVDPEVDVVFVHGLRLPFARKTDWGGDHGASSFWPAWLEQDFPNVRVGMLSYTTPAFDPFGRALHIEDQAMDVLGELHADGIGERPVIFVAHSLGGLVVKEMLLRSREETDGKRDIAALCRGVAFLATPHLGADLALIAKELWPSATGEALATLSPSNRHVAHLAARYRQWATNRTGIQHVVCYETRTTAGFTVVSQASADPKIDNVVPVPVHTDHNKIAVPTNRDAVVYQEVKHLIERVMVSLATTASVPNTTPPTSGCVRQALKNYFRDLDAQLLELEVERDNIRYAEYGLDPYEHVVNADQLRLNQIEIRIAEVIARASDVPDDVELEIRADEKRASRRIDEIATDANDFDFGE